ncbi:hypothetical protein, partial [Lactococcus petauri]|uniref:hypothetical protein n=1 Tax=Lactococcus petauri TaxID=1940789 RepID=UPI0021F12313
DGAAQRVFDKNWSTKMERNRLIAEGLMNVLGDKAGMKVAEFVARGISAGMPLDVSGRLGLHNLIPGTGIFLKKDAYQRDVAELGGPAG